MSTVPTEILGKKVAYLGSCCRTHWKIGLRLKGHSWVNMTGLQSDSSSCFLGMLSSAGQLISLTEKYDAAE